MEYPALEVMSAVRESIYILSMKLTSFSPIREAGIIMLVTSNGSNDLAALQKDP